MEMRVTIVAVDNRVVVEGQAEKVDCSSLDEEIHAIQWYSGRGEIEYKMDFIACTRKMNRVIGDLAPYQHLIDLWMIEAQKPAVLIAPPRPISAQPQPAQPQPATPGPVNVIAH